MKISTKGRYGLRALIDLAVYSTQGHVSLVNIAKRQKISLNYLEQLFAILRKESIVRSVKGAQGGYCLADRAEKIKICVVLKALEGNFCIIDKIDDTEKRTDFVQLAIEHLVWDKINQRANEYLENTSLADLAKEYSKIYGKEENIYYI